MDRATAAHVIPCPQPFVDDTFNSQPNVRFLEVLNNGWPHVFVMTTKKIKVCAARSPVPCRWAVPLGSVRGEVPALRPWATEGVADCFFMVLPAGTAMSPHRHAAMPWLSLAAAALATTGGGGGQASIRMADSGFGLLRNTCLNVALAICCDMGKKDGPPNTKQGLANLTVKTLGLCELTP